MPTRAFADDENKDKLPKLPDNELDIPILIKSKGVSKIIRNGGHKENFIISIIYNDKPISFVAPKNWTHILKNFREICAAHMMDKDLVDMLEYHLIDNSKWVNGFGRTSDLPNCDKSAMGAGYIDETLTQEPVEVSIPDAIRVSYGNVITVGLIVSMSDPFQLVKTERWQCASCNKSVEHIVINMLEPLGKIKDRMCQYCQSFKLIAKHDFIDARALRIQHDDVTATNSMDAFNVIVFGNDTKDIKLGERVKLTGNIKMRQSPRNKEQYTNVALIRNIEYKDRRKIEVTPEDIIEIKEFRKLENHIEELINQFAPNVVGHRFAKLGILLAAVGAPEYFSKDPITNKKRTTARGRINTLAIGEPGEAKTVLGNEATKLRPNSKSVSGTNTTGKAMTAMILPDPNGGRQLHLGPIALAKDAFFFINEFDKLPGEDRDSILGAMEEGRFGFNKFDANLDIEAQISVFATANPLNEKWLSPDSININEIPFTIRMLSRFDIITIFRDKNTKEDDMRYAEEKTEAMNLKDVNYDFLIKFIEYAREYYEPMLTDESAIALQDYWVMMRDEFRMMDTDFTAAYKTTKRTLEVAYRLSKAFARLNLSDRVTMTEVNQTINFITDMFKDFKLNIDTANDPFIDAQNETIKVIKDTTIDKPIKLVDAVEIACANNKTVADYIGRKFKQDENKKLKNLCKKVLEDKHVIRVGEKPTKVYWKTDDKPPLSDLNDLSDPGNSDPAADQEISHAQEKSKASTGSKKLKSDRPDRSDRTQTDALSKLEPQTVVTNEQNNEEKLNTSLTIESNNKNLLVLKEQQQYISPISDFICFDLEWDIETQVIMAFSYVASNGASGVVLIEDHNGVEKLLLKQLLAILSRYEYCFGWYSSGTSKFNNKKKKYEGKDSDLKTLDARLKANKLESIVDLQGFPRIINPKYNGNSKLSYDQRKSLKSMIHIDAHNIYNKPMVQKQIYNQSYLGYSLNSVAKAIVGRGKFSGYSGVDFCNMSTEDKRKYSFEDSQLLYEILAHDNFRVLKQMKTISDLTGVSIEAVCNYGPSNIWEAYYK